MKLYDMNIDEYIENFNKKRSLEARKLSKKIIRLYEEESGDKPPYNDHSNLRDKISKFLSELDTIKYTKLSGSKLKRNRDESLLKNTKIEIRAFPINQEFNHSWNFLAYDLDSNLKYFWNEGKEMEDKYKKINFIYFNPQDIIDDFLSLNLIKYPLTKEEKIKIINFLEKYGPCFARYYHPNSSLVDEELYFRYFWNDYVDFKKAYEIIKSGKPSKFPNASCPPRIVNKWRKNNNYKDYANWEKEVGNPQLNFKLSLTSGHLPTKKNSPQDIRNLGRGIGIISNYLYENCKKLITCKYSKCNKNFFQTRKNESGCCPYHSSLARNEKYKKNKKLEKS